MTFNIEHFEDKPVRKPIGKTFKKLRMKKPLFIGARVFIRTFKESTPFVIYTV